MLLHAVIDGFAHHMDEQREVEIIRKPADHKTTDYGH